jgi:PAS domain S-box-containing protein
MAKRAPRRRGAQRAEEVLAASEATLALFLEWAPDAMVIVDRDGLITLVNDEIEAMFGYSRDELLGNPVEILLPESLWQAHVGHRAGYLSDPHMRPMGIGLNIIGRRKDGSEFPADIKLSAVQAGEHLLVAGVVRDITDLKRAAEGREREEWLSTTLRSIGDAVIATDAKGRVTFLNPAAQSLTGWKQREAVGRALADVFNIVNEETGRPVEDPVTRVMREGLIVGLGNHTVLIARDGTRRNIDDSGASIRGSQGNITGVVLVFHDISEQKQAAEELRRLTARLLEMQEEDRRRVAYDIHDGLGQMLTAASMHLEVFSGRREEAARDGEFAKAKRCLQDAVVEMRRMVSELGPLLLEEVGLVEASRRLLADMAGRGGWETEFEGEVNLDRLDRMAEMALFRIVQEALANAAKHSETKKVRISIREEDDALYLEVRDWGKGFDVSGVLAQRGPGLHVGLLGMRERAALLGGEFKIESAPGKGTKLVVTVLVAAATAPVIGKKKVEVVKMVEARKGRESARQGITVLIADDHPMVREGLRSMLDADEISVIGEAATGAEAVERVQQLNPDVVLMDVRMPDMDGLAATEVVKQGFPDTSVIVITSYESKDYLRRAIEAGAAGYLLKGMSRDSLIEAIRLVRGGGSLIDARLLSELLREMGVEGSRFQGAEGALEALTPREQEVLQLLVRGLTNKEIAAEMHYSVGTVKNVVQRVIEKLGVSDRTQAAVYAVRAGVSPPP